MISFPRISFSEFRLRQTLRARPAAWGSYSIFLAESAVFDLLTLLAGVRGFSWHPLRKPLAFAWLSLWAKLQLRFEMRSDEDDFFCWDRHGSSSFLRMASLGAVRCSDRFWLAKPSGSSRESFPDALSMSIANCASLPSIGCDETDWLEWVGAMEALLARSPGAAVRFAPLGYSPHSGLEHPVEHLLLAAARAPERLLSSPEYAEASARALLGALSLSSRSLDFPRVAALAVSALSSCDPRGDFFRALAKLPGGDEALLSQGALTSPHPVAAALRESASLRKISSAPPRRSPSRSL